MCQKNTKLKSINVIFKQFKDEKYYLTVPEDHANKYKEYHVRLPNTEEQGDVGASMQLVVGLHQREGYS